MGGMFAELLALPGVTEEMRLGSRFGFMAFHGGSLEEWTDRIAGMAAEASGASVYLVRQPPGLRWHVPSRWVRPADSPALAAFLDHVTAVVAVHGYGRHGYWTSLLVGGRGRRLAAHVAGHLRAALPAYAVIATPERIPRPLRGMHPDNPVNAPGVEGVQLELPPRVRGMGPFWRGRPDGPGGDRPASHTRRLVEALAAAATTWGAEGTPG